MTSQEQLAGTETYQDTSGETKQEREAQDRQLGELAERAAQLSERARRANVTVDPETGEVLVGREAEELSGKAVDPNEMYKSK